MNTYEVVIKVDGAWGTRYVERQINAKDMEHAEEIAMDILENIDLRDDENDWGAYEEAYIDYLEQIA